MLESAESGRRTACASAHEEERNEKAAEHHVMHHDEGSLSRTPGSIDLLCGVDGSLFSKSCAVQQDKGILVASAVEIDWAEQGIFREQGAARYRLVEACGGFLKENDAAVAVGLFKNRNDHF